MTMYKGPTLEETSAVDAGADFASALIEQMEQKLQQHNQLDDYDVYCEWDDEDLTSMEVWLRDRSDDSRIGPLDYRAMIAH